MIRRQLRLMAITDPAARAGTLAAAEAALAAGVPSLQMRWKEARARDFLALAERLRDATRRSGALLLVNDRIDIALAVEADGAHLGDDDLPLAAARRITPAGFILGRSVDNASEAAAAEAAGADYVGLGPIFSTRSKNGLGEPIGPAGVAAVRESVDLPIVAIGGIGVSNAGSVIRAGADGVAAIGAIMNEADPGAATRRLLDAVERGGNLPESDPQP